MGSLLAKGHRFAENHLPGNRPPNTEAESEHETLSAPENCNRTDASSGACWRTPSCGFVRLQKGQDTTDWDFCFLDQQSGKMRSVAPLSSSDSSRSFCLARRGEAAFSSATAFRGCGI